MADDPIKKGYLFYYAKGTNDKERQWQENHCQIFTRGPHGQSRFDWFKEELASASQQPRRTIYLEQIGSVDILSPISEWFAYGFQISHGPTAALAGLKGKPPAPKFATNRKEDMMGWLAAFTYLQLVEGKGENDSAVPALVVEVTVSQSEASTLYGISERIGLLFIRPHDISFSDKADSSNALPQPKFTWPYRHIRRFGGSASSFTMECGHKCQFGAGLLVFLTRAAPLVLDIVAKYTKRLATVSSGSPAGTLKASPESPRRDWSKPVAPPTRSHAKPQLPVRMTNPLREPETVSSRGGYSSLHSTDEKPGAEIYPVIAKNKTPSSNPSELSTSGVAAKPPLPVIQKQATIACDNSFVKADATKPSQNEGEEVLKISQIASRLQNQGLLQNQYLLQNRVEDNEEAGATYSTVDVVGNRSSRELLKNRGVEKDNVMKYTTLDLAGDRHTSCSSTQSFVASEQNDSATYSVLEIPGRSSGHLLPTTNDGDDFYHHILH